MRGQRTLNMTRGVIWKQLLLFAAPLLLSNLFQQLYNTVDGIVVGQFVGKDALAAIGATLSIINTIIGFFMGLATGGGVIISQAFGARDEERLSRAVHTTILLSLLMGVGIMGVGFALAGPLLRLMATPEDVFGDALTYLRIYFLGGLGVAVYNMASGILRAVGDSRRPLYLLIFSSVLNVGLDLLLVAGFGMKIEGVALATVIAQALSAAGLLLVLGRSREVYRLQMRKLRMDRASLGQILRTGIPVGVQNAFISFSNVFAQSYINVYQSTVMAGWTAMFRLHQFALMPIQSMAMAVTTFSGQNHGAGDERRAARGTGIGLAMALAATVVLSAVMMLWREGLIAIFNTEPEVIAWGAQFALIFAPFHVGICFEQVLSGSIRGAGESRGPMLIVLGCYAVLRQIYLFVVSRVTTGVIPIVFGYPFGWVTCALILIVYYLSGRWKKRKA